MMTVRAKMYCGAKMPQPDGSATIYLNAVYSNKDGTRAEENKEFSDATPNGVLTLHIAAGKPAQDQFSVGEHYYIDITKVA